MLNLQEPSHLHVMGEIVDRSNFMWTNAPYTQYDHDFAKYPLADDDERSLVLHRRIDVDYNGWWMCMIPRQVAEELGQPLPLFIKWDDADYGLRAGEHGYGTVTMPGTAIWHMAWSDKDDAIDWQAYFHLRNRLVVSALHWDGPIGGLLASSLKATLKHLLCLEYSTVAIQNRAIADFLGRPGAHLLHPGVGAARGPQDARAVLRRGGAAGRDVAAQTQRPHQGAQAAGVVARHRFSARPRRIPPDAQGEPGPPRAPAAQRAHPGRPLVPAVQRRRRHGHHRRRPRRGVPPARPGQDVRAAARVDCASTSGWPASTTEMRKVYRKALPVLSSKEKWETVLLDDVSGQCLTARTSRNRSRRRPPARSPHWWPCSPPWPPRRWSRSPGAMSHFGEHAQGWVALSALGALVAAETPPRLAAGRCRRRRGPRGRDRYQARGPSQAAPPPGDRGNVGTPERTEFPLGARDVHHRRGYAAVPGHPARRYPWFWCPRWPCRGWCSVCIIPSDVLAGVAVGAAVARIGRHASPHRRRRRRSECDMSEEAAGHRTTEQPGQRDRQGHPPAAVGEEPAGAGRAAGRARRQRHLRLPRRRCSRSSSPSWSSAWRRRRST